MKIMRIITALALALSFAVTATAQEKQAPGKDGDAPRLVIAELVHDFGEVKAGTPLRYSFKIKNEGKSDLLIQSVTPG
ncbi:MAG TPA: DUF1573 domain-containing protein [Blastocatellia bacterium]|jgi:hypothetical protein|nr:DUF1573 domain-containing protein [Blastocatellia bacterium]